MQNKAVTGFLGRMGDLGAINPKFDIAISSCCPQLNHYIVEVFFLKRHFKMLKSASNI